MKHTGIVKNTGRKCIVVFRELYNEQGHVVDPNTCLVLETESLPDAEHEEIMRIVESEAAQETPNIYNVFNRTRLGNGSPALSWMHQTGRLRKFPTNNVALTPNSHTLIDLDEVNKIVKLQNSGMSEDDINQVLQDDTDSPPREMNQTVTSDDTPGDSVATSTESGDDVLGDAELAKNYLSQADVFEAQAKELREQAYELDPTLNPQNQTTQEETPAQKEN